MPPFHLSDEPLIRRSRYFDRFPQLPAWISTPAHMEAKDRFLKKIRSTYSYENLNQCPLCENTEFIWLANQERHGLPISVVLCTNCSLAFNNPRLSRESMEDHYRTDARAVERGEAQDLHQQMFQLQASKGPGILKFIHEALKKSSIERKIESVVEVGCGEGGMLSVLRNYFPKITGFELNPTAASFGRNFGLDIRASVLDKSKASSGFDLVIYEQVIEHIHDLDSEVALVAETQDVGGLLYIGVPGLFHIPTHYDHNFLSYLEYQHLYHFTLSSLEGLMKKFGYALVDGDEEVRSLFVKVAAPESIQLKTRAVPAEEILEFLKTEAKALSERPDVSMKVHFKYLVKYILYRSGLSGVLLSRKNQTRKI